MSRLMPIKQMYGMMRNSGNPQAFLSQMAMQNPQVKQAIDIVNQNNGDAKAAFYKLAQERGVDPDQIIGMLNGQ